MSSVLNALYTIVIGPIELLFEAIFYTTRRFTTSGISIVVLSLVMNILLLPLYNKAEQIQQEENETQLKLKPVVNHIKKSFKGDEQYMMLQTYYRINNYKPYYVLRGSISLLIQIPFFIAAYSFLSNLNLADETNFAFNFLFIKDLCLPDGLLYGINVLPILMTIINIVSSAIYTKGQPIKTKIQLYLMAAVFLILLYDKPAGLSLYYLLNNIFSLFKNIYYKFRNKKLLSVVIMTLGVIGILFSALFPQFTLRARLILFVMFALVIGINYTVYADINILKKSTILNKIKINWSIFFICTLSISVLIGLLVPSQLIMSSTEEFVEIQNLISPNKYIGNTFLYSIGAFVLWINVYYSLMSDSIKKIMTVSSFAIIFIFLFDYLFINNNYGTMSNALIYDQMPSLPTWVHVVNVIIIIAFSIVTVIQYIKSPKVTVNIVLVLLISVTILSFVNIAAINKSYKKTKTKLIENNSYNSLDDIDIKLSKEGHNVILIELDRAIGSFFPYVLNENTELYNQYSDFTYYPNTISFGPCTNISTPSEYGGYEYTPKELNKDIDRMLSEKHNEALKVLPVMFGNNNYNVMIFDPPFAGYEWIPDLSIYNEYSFIKSYNATEISKKEIGNSELEELNKKLFFYGLSKVSPSFVFKTIYANGDYLLLESTENYTNFIIDFNVLNRLPNITSFDNDKNVFVEFQNDITHQPVLLNESNYIDVVEEYSDKRKQSILGEEIELTNKNQISHYDVNVAALKEVGEWIDFLKKNDVYDNTRIIICSDHGRDLGVYKDYYAGDIDLMNFDALLIVKDFNSKGFKVEKKLMTLADIPYIASKDIIENPSNPFTGNLIDDNTKQDLEILYTEDGDVSKNNRSQFMPGTWLSVKEDSEKASNWSIIAQNR